MRGPQALLARRQSTCQTRSWMRRSHIIALARPTARFPPIRPAPLLRPDAVCPIWRALHTSPALWKKGDSDTANLESLFPEYYIKDNVLNGIERMLHVRQVLHDQQNANPNSSSASASRALHVIDPVYYRHQKYVELEQQKQQSEELAATEQDADMRSLAQEEVQEVEAQLEQERDNLRSHLISVYDRLYKVGVQLIKARSNSEAIKADTGTVLTGTREVGPGVEPEGVIVECRPGVGGGEAGLFTYQVARMLQKFASNAGWTVDVMSETPMDVSTTTQTNSDAMKEVLMRITDPLADTEGRVNIYERMRWEGGVHRVQRVPITQSTGKLQTSTMAAVVLPVMPETGDNKNDEFYIDPKEVKVETMRSRGAGGQHVNKTESAIRLTHEPTGTVVSMQDSRSQHQNRAKAWIVLRARLQERARQAEMMDNVAVRIEQVQTMDRWDRIRTYNFPQSRVTDHRAGMSVNNIGAFMDGDFDGDWDNPRGGLALFMEECRRLDHEQKLAQLQSLYKQALQVVYQSHQAPAQ